MPDLRLLRLAYERGSQPIDDLVARIDQERIDRIRRNYAEVNSPENRKIQCVPTDTATSTESTESRDAATTTEIADTTTTEIADTTSTEVADEALTLPPDTNPVTVSNIIREDAARDIEQNLDVATPILDAMQLERHRSRSFAIRAALDLNYLLLQYDQCDDLVLAIADSPHDIVISSDDYDGSLDDNDSITLRFLPRDASLAQIMHFVEAVIGELPHENDENDDVMSAYRTLEIMTAPLRSSGAWSDDDTHHRPVRVSPEEHAREAIEHEKLLRKSRTNALIRYQRLFDGTMWPVLTSSAEEKTIAAAKERKIEQSKARVEKAEKNRFDELDTQRLALKVKRILAKINDNGARDDAKDDDDDDNEVEYQKQRRQEKAAERRRGRLENERQEYGLRSVRPRIWSSQIDSDIVEWRPR